MNRRRIAVFMCFLMMMFLMVMGCSKSDDAVPAGATYSVSGTVTGTASVTMNLTGDVTATTTTDAITGTYSFAGIPSGSNVTVTPVKTGFTFADLSAGGTLTSNQTGVDFVATVNTGLPYTISGKVSGAVLAGVQINLTGDATGQTVTNASGNYSFTGVALNGNYTVTPSKTGYMFSPNSLGVLVSGADSTGNNFTATANAAATWHIAGTVHVGATLTGEIGVTITLSGGEVGTAITTTDASGTYIFDGLLDGEYTVTPSKLGYTFANAHEHVTIAAGNQNSIYFDSTKNADADHTIDGTVSGAVGGGVTVYLTGDANATAVTDGSGNYMFTGLAHGTYTVTPVLATFKFAPTSLEANITDLDRTGIDFVSSDNALSTYSISGTVSGDVKSGVKITLSGAGSGTTTTNATGNYSFAGLVNGNYTVTPTLDTYTITPLSLSPTISGANVTGQNFVVGTAPSTWSQADLVGTWRMNMLKRGRNSSGTPVNEWNRARVSINAAGVASCLSVEGSFADSNVCPSPFYLTFTMNPTTGVVTQTGYHAADDGGHITMTSNKNFGAGTATNGTSPNLNYQLMIIQKEESVTYSAADVQSKSIVYHQLMVGDSNIWEYGAATTGSPALVNISSSTTPSGTTTPGDTGCTIVVDTLGVVTLTGASCDMGTFSGFLSGDKKTIVGTRTELLADTYQLYIFQIVEDGDQTPGLMPAGPAAAHMLGANASAAGWVHSSITVAPGGGIAFSNWADSFGGAPPTAAYTGNITDTRGTCTITGDATYHGQMSHDGKFVVGTQTTSTVHFLNVITK